MDILSMKSHHSDISIHGLSGMARVLLAHMMEIASPHVRAPLFDRTGTVVGHIAVFDSDTLDNEDTVLRVVRLFDHRAEAELERLALERKHELLIEELRVENEQLHQAAVTDALTGLLNRRGFYERAEQLLTWSRTTGNDLAAAVVDLDGLKSVNDRFGHEAGDRVIAAFADRLRDVLTEAVADGASCRASAMASPR
jgi:predicted signal transduction protein with EAL and GGDEF domain